ncbi:MAG: hypothetical protein JNK78_12930 [Planctomycetes bacterium]|nr:hypothetical protein [Planctomycetota bacterium]
MKGLRGVSLVPAVALVAVVAQALLAGAATLSRRAAEHELERESGVTASYTAQLSHGVQGQAAAAVAGPHAELLPSADVAGTLRVLQNLGDQCKVTLASVKAAPSTTPGRQSFAITGRGSPTDLCTLFAAIERHERLMVIEAGKVSPGTGDEVSFEIALSTHHAGGVR